MGKLTDVTAKGDPLDPISVVGFASDEEAFTFVQQGFQLKGLTPTFSGRLVIGGSINFEGNPYAVFSYFNQSGVLTLLAVIQVFGDLSLNVGSWGAQMLVTANNR